MFKSLRCYALLELVLFGMITFGLTLGGAALVSVFGNKVGHSGFPGCALILHWPDQTRVDRGPIVVGEILKTKPEGGVITIDAGADNNNTGCFFGIDYTVDLVVDPSN
jgi:hypothetical protein